MNFSQNDSLPINIRALLEKISRHTPILFTNNSRPSPISSSVLLKYKSTYFLVSSGHTFKYHSYDDLGLIFNHTFLPLSGKNITSVQKSIESDRIDIGVCLLSDNFMNQLSPDYKFFDIESFDIDHDDTMEDEYIIFGMPLTRIKMKEKKGKIELNPFVFKTSIVNEQHLFNKMSINQQGHLILNYRKRSITNIVTKQSMQGPEPRGTSGCGVWRIKNPSNDTDPIEYYPTGMIIEYYREYNAMVATRIRIITEALRQLYNNDIPKSLKMTLNIGHNF